MTDSRAPAAWRGLPAALAALLCSCLVPQPAAADGGALYLGAGAGYTLSTYRQADLDNAVINTFAASGYTLALSSSSVQNQHTPWSVDVGYRFSTYFGLEAAYLELGTLNYASAGTATSILGGAPATTSLSIRSHGPALAFVGVLPLTDAFGLEARLGAYEGKTVTQFAVTVGGTPSSGTDSQTSASLLAGVGTSYIVAAHWVVRLGYVHLNQLGEKTLGKSFNVDLLTAGVDYVF